MDEAPRAADAANRAKSEFLSSMSHEIRTPMNAILGFAQLLDMDPSLSESQHHDLDHITRAGKHLLDLINDILEMSRIESGRTTLDLKSTEIPHMLVDLEMMIGATAKAKSLRLAIQKHGELPSAVLVDENKLRQVLANLLGNAIKFTGVGGVTLDVSAEQHDSGATRLAFTVSDTGMGIPEHDVGRAFDAFEQAASGRRLQGGTGLGLAISQAFIRMMGGEITVSSQVGQGSAFRFDIPVNEVPRESGATSVTTTRRVVGLQPGQEHVRVLVVDDNSENRELLAQMLSRVGFVIREAVN